MLILVSGEGPTDMGRCAGTEPVTGAAFEAGPMAWLVDQIAETSEGYPFIPMLPNPKSEAWLLCALKPNQPYQHCAQIEDESGNDAGLDALKSQLERALGEPPTATLLAELVREGRVDAARIEMASFVRFRERLKSVLRDPSGTRAPKGVD